MIATKTFTDSLIQSWKNEILTKQNFNTKIKKIIAKEITTIAIANGLISNLRLIYTI